MCSKTLIFPFCFEIDLNTSPAVMSGYLNTNFWRPEYVRDSLNSWKFMVFQFYPSLARAKTAFGPASTPPSIIFVKCTPKKGNVGFGTG